MAEIKLSEARVLQKDGFGEKPSDGSYAIAIVSVGTDGVGGKALGMMLLDESKRTPIGSGYLVNEKNVAIPVNSNDTLVIDTPAGIKINTVIAPTSEEFGNTPDLLKYIDQLRIRLRKTADVWKLNIKSATPVSVENVGVISLKLPTTPRYDYSVAVSGVDNTTVNIIDPKIFGRSALSPDNSLAFAIIDPKPKVNPSTKLSYEAYTAANLNLDPQKRYLVVYEKKHGITRGHLLTEVGSRDVASLLRRNGDKIADVVKESRGVPVPVAALANIINQGKERPLGGGQAELRTPGTGGPRTSEEEPVYFSPEERDALKKVFNRQVEVEVNKRKTMVPLATAITMAVERARANVEWRDRINEEFKKISDLYTLLSDKKVSRVEEGVVRKKLSSLNLPGQAGLVGAATAWMRVLKNDLETAMKGFRAKSAIESPEQGPFAELIDPQQFLKFPVTTATGTVPSTHVAIRSADQDGSLHPAA